MTVEHSFRKGAKVELARKFRKVLTKPELWLWLRLRQRASHGLVFRSQHPFGPYVLDFYCPRAKLYIEVDGESHTHDRQQIRDEIRDKWLSNNKIYVHRIVASDLLRDPDEAANIVVDMALGRLLKAPPTAFGGPPSP